MIANGNGVGTNYATRPWHGQQNGGMGEENILSYETFPHPTPVKTYNVNAQIPDSAGTATAMHAGVKTKAGMIGVDETLTRGDCSAMENAKVTSIATLLPDAGKSSAAMSTARLTHATPATVYAHSGDRNFKAASNLPAGCAQKDIAIQLIDSMEAGIVDVATGGGRRNFISADMKDEEGFFLSVGAGRVDHAKSRRQPAPRRRRRSGQGR